MRKRKLVLISLVAVAALAASAFWLAPQIDGRSLVETVRNTVAPADQDADGQASKPSGEAAAAEVQPAPAIRVIAAERIAMSETLTVDGTVVAREEASVGTDLNGLTVIALHADEGDRVAAGQLLATLDDSTLRLQLTQLEAARAQIEAQVAQSRAQIGDAEVGVRQAEEQLARLEPLRTKGVVSKAQYDNGVNQRDSARARLETARKALVAAEAQRGVNAAQARDVENKIAKAQVSAPAAGLVLARNATLGAVVGPSAGPLFRIAIDAEFELAARVAETQLPRLAEGMAVSIGLAGLERPLDGRIRLIAPEVDPVSRLGTLRIALPPDPAVRAGNFASGEIVIAERDALAVPAGAVVWRGREAFVQRVADGVVHTTAVKPGIRAAGKVEILSGLAEGDLVVSRAGTFVADGDRINPVADEVTGAIAR